MSKLTELWKKIQKWLRDTFNPPGPGPTPEPGALVPIKIACGGTCGVPMPDKSNRPRGTERIHRIGPFPDFRTLEVGGGPGNDAFLDPFILDAIRISEDGLWMAGDDMIRGSVTYKFDHFSPKTSSANDPRNPLPLDKVDTSSCRAWWRCHSKT